MVYMATGSLDWARTNKSSQQLQSNATHLLSSIWIVPQFNSSFRFEAMIFELDPCSSVFLCVLFCLSIGHLTMRTEYVLTQFLVCATQLTWWLKVSLVFCFSSLLFMPRKSNYCVRISLCGLCAPYRFYLSH